MLCLSGFELYSRWVPLTAVSRDLDPGSSQVIGRALLGFLSYHSGFPSP